jgi:hypothetical protein
MDSQSQLGAELEEELAGSAPSIPPTFQIRLLNLKRLQNQDQMEVFLILEESGSEPTRILQIRYRLRIADSPMMEVT